MSDLENNLRRHYEEQRLADARVEAILTAGRAAARARRMIWFAAAAAIAVTGLVGLGLWQRTGKTHASAVALIQPQDIGAEIVRYFAPTGYTLSKVSANPDELVAWLQAQGAPAGLTLPPNMARLPSFGCQVLEVQGRRVFLICFFLDVTAAELAGGMIKPEMVVTAPDGTMMKKNRPLVHLVVADAGAFRDPPKPGAHVQFSGTGDWKFETWSQAGILYVAGTTAAGDRLSEVARSL
jgi:hypothetical protein